MKPRVFVALLGPAFFGAACGDGGGGESLPGAEISSAKIDSVSPEPGAANVSLSAIVEARFSAFVEPSSVSAASFLLFRGGNQVPAQVTCDGIQATLIPHLPLAPATAYQARLSATILGEEFSWWFVTKDTNPPKLISVSPADGAALVPLESQVSVLFSETIDAASVVPESLVLEGPAGPVPGALSPLGSGLLFVPSEALEENSVYHATLSAGLKDLDGNSFSEPFSWSFTSTEFQAPHWIELFPPNGSKNVSQNATISVAFSEEINPSSVHAGSFFLLSPSGAVVPTAASAQGDKANLAPLSPLGYGKKYKAFCLQGIEDLAGNNLQNEAIWEFQVEAPPPPCNPDLLEQDDSSSPESISVGIDDLGNALVVWQQYVPISAGGDGQASVWSIRYSIEEMKWTPAFAEMVDTEAAQQATGPYMVMNPAGDALAVWRQTGSGGLRPFARWFRAATGNWDSAAPALLDSGAFLSMPPAIAIDANGNALAIWSRSSSTGQWGVYAKRWSAAAAQWEPAEPVLLGSGAGTANPAVALDGNGDGLAIWNSGFNVVARRFDSSAGEWLDLALPPETISLPGASFPSGNALGASKSGRAIAVWRQIVSPANGGDGSSSLYGRAFDFASGQWDAAGPVALENVPDGVYESPRLAIDSGGNGVVVWAQQISVSAGGDGKASIYARRFDGASGQWLLPPLAAIENDTAGQGDFPQIGVTAAGVFHAIWIQAGSVVRSQLSPAGAWSVPSALAVKPSSPLSALAVNGAGRLVAAWPDLTPSEEVVNLIGYVCD